MENNEILNELQKIKNLTLISAKEVFTISEVGIITGLSKSHIYKLVNGRKIPYYKIPGKRHIYFKKQEINDWMLQHRVKTADEIDAEAQTYILNKRKV